MKTNKPLSGIIVPLITPLLDNNTIDHAGIERLTEHVLEGGVHGLFILGTTGEGPSLSYSLRYELVERVCKQVNQRVPVLVGVTDTSSIESLGLADKATDCGAHGVVATPPYFFESDQNDLVAYFEYLSSRLSLPLYLYNMPSHAKVVLEPDTVRKIAENKNVAGLKDSSANFVYFQKLIHIMSDRPDFSLTVGPEEGLMQSILAGGHGGVNGGANMFPYLYVDMYEAAIARDFERMIPLQKLIIRISTYIYSVDKTGSAYLKGLKTALSLMGLCSDFLAEPLHQFGDREKMVVQRHLKELEQYMIQAGTGNKANRKSI